MKRGYMEVFLYNKSDHCELEEMTLEHIKLMSKYIGQRRIESCEYSLTTLFMWKKMYNPHLYINDNYMIIFELYQNECYALMPLCKEEYILESFEKTIEIFKELKEGFEMYCVDSLYANRVKQTYSDHYLIKDDRDNADYIYDGETLRNLSGKKLRKKKNHINAFKRLNENQYEFKLLGPQNKGEIMVFLNEWCQQHGELTTHLQEEIDGIEYILDHVDALESKLAGIYIKEKLEALTIGSLINDNEAVIHVEKANHSFRGLYPYINQQFLLEVFPSVDLVNREDDLGIEGLRKAKLSYEPLRLEDKYTITPK